MGGFFGGSNRRGLRAPVAALTMTGLSALTLPATASTATPIYEFHGTFDGGTPEGGLIMGKDGVIYGTTDRGGGTIRNAGVVFSLTPPNVEGGTWTRKILYRFSGGKDGGYPLGLVLDKSGNLFGYAFDSTSGYGSVFLLEKPATDVSWRYRLLYEFKGGTDGAYPNGLSLMPDGTLVGSTSRGGIGKCYLPGDDFSSGCGVVFQLKPPAKAGSPWTEILLHSFMGGTDGAVPNGSPLLRNGVLWGVTVQGGTGKCTDLSTGRAAGCGTVYKLANTSPSGWAATTPFSFQGGSSGWCPAGGLAADSAGLFYGVAACGGDGSSLYGKGLVYRLTPSGDGFSMAVLHTFTGPSDGYSPKGGLIVTGTGNAVYGTTYLGPDGLSRGTVFLLRQRPAGSGQWVEYVIGRFTDPVGVYPSGAIVRDRLNAIYGVTLQGGRYNQGTVFKVVE